MELDKILQTYGRHLFSSPDTYIHSGYVGNFKVWELVKYCQQRCANIVLVREKLVTRVGANGISGDSDLSKRAAEILPQLPAPEIEVAEV